MTISFITAHRWSLRSQCICSGITRLQRAIVISGGNKDQSRERKVKFQKVTFHRQVSFSIPRQTSHKALISSSSSRQKAFCKHHAEEAFMGPELKPYWLPKSRYWCEVLIMHSKNSRQRGKMERERMYYLLVLFKYGLEQFFKGVFNIKRLLNLDFCKDKEQRKIKKNARFNKYQQTFFRKASSKICLDKILYRN